jgi:uncharacterized protein YcbK (DUF882 family)
LKLCVTSPPWISTRRLLRSAGLVAATVLGVVASVRGTQDAVANGDTRTISIQHAHTKETATVTFRRDGRYDSTALDTLNWLLRDWRHDEPTKMDPRLFDIVWEVHRSVGSSAPIHVVSAYRSPATNSMLRRRSRGVAKHSQHMLGKAMDFSIPDVDMARVRAIGMRLQHGGVGYYPNAHNVFVHLDSGSVRSWPRMPRDQLARLFPDGKTVHLPADGKPMQGYDEARSFILARGGSVAGYASYAEAEEDQRTTGRGKSLWASLFGAADDEDSDYLQATGQARTSARGAAPQSRGRSTVAALPPSASNSNDAGSATFFAEPVVAAAPVRAAVAPRRPAPPPEEPTRVAALPAPPDLREPVPIPLARPQNLVEQTRVAGLADPGAGPTLAWREGPAAIETKPTLAPLPPRRPDETTPALAFATAPLPPTRPQVLASLEPDAVEPAASPAVAAIGVSHPLPPLRPGLAAAVPAAPAPVAPPAPAIVTASLQPPQPAAAPARPPAPASRGFPPSAKLDEDKAALRSLFAAVATDVTPTGSVRVSSAKPRVAPATGELVAATDSGLNLGFGSQAEPPQGRFAGPAVRPLPVRR